MMTFKEKALVIIVGFLLVIIAIPILGTILLTLLAILFIYDWWLKTDFKQPVIEPINDLDLPNPVLTDDAKLANFLMAKRSYLTSQTWQIKRSIILKQYGYECGSCGCLDNLEIHHTGGYAQIPNEPKEFLIPLCRECHERQHRYYGFPKTYQDYMNWYAPLID